MKPRPLPALAVALVFAACPRAPGASLVLPENVLVHQPAVLRGAVVDPVPGRSVAAYRWDFGDGTPVLTTAADRIQHTWSAPGTWEVTLWVVDSDGLEGRDVQGLQVLSASPPADAGPPVPTDAGAADAAQPVPPDGGVPQGCRNNAWDGEETDLDCGGGTCCRCVAGQRCARNADCTTGICSSGSCAGQRSGGPWISSSVRALSTHAEAFTPARMDADCTWDALVTSGTEGAVTAVFNLANPAPRTVTLRGPAGGTAASAAWVDATGDNIPDVVGLLQGTPNPVAWSGDGASFGSPILALGPFGDGSLQGLVAAVHRRGQTTDAFAATDSLFTLMGLRAGAFVYATQNLNQVGAPVVALSSADVDGDDVDEVLAASESFERAVIQWVPPDVLDRNVDVPLPPGSTAVWLGHVSGDARAEILVGTNRSLHVMRVSGMTVRQLARADVGGGVRLVRAGDPFADGTREVLTLTEGGVGITWRLRSETTLEEVETWSACASASDLAAVDVNGDGNSELVLACGDQGIQILERFLE